MKTNQKEPNIKFDLKSLKLRFPTLLTFSNTKSSIDIFALSKKFKKSK